MPPVDYTSAPVRESFTKHRTSSKGSYSLVAKMVVQANPAEKTMMCLPILLEESLGDKLAL